MRLSQRFVGLPVALLLGTGFGLCFIPQVHADSLTTLFAADNSNTVGGIVYFDLNVLAAGGLTVNSFAVNTQSNGTPTPAGTSFSLEIYTRTGTFSGFETSSAGWTQISTGSGVSGGINTPVLVDTTDFSLGAGVTGVGVRYVGITPVYTNGTGANQSYSNASVALTAGSAQSAPFDPSIFTPRVFNGTINYTLKATAAPEPGSLALLLPVMGTVGMVVRKRRKQ